MRFMTLSFIVILCSSLAACDGAGRLPTDPQGDSEVTIPTVKSEHALENGRVSGGGLIVEGPWRVSLAGQARVVGGPATPIWANGVQFDDVDGHWVLQLHRVSGPQVDGATFRSTRVQRLQFFPNAGAVGCTAGARVHLEGALDGVAGWTALVIVVDGSGGNDDTVRLLMWGPSGEEYRTNLDFSGESTCAGERRTGLDSGNMTVRFPFPG